MPPTCSCASHRHTATHEPSTVMITDAVGAQNSVPELRKIRPAARAYGAPAAGHGCFPGSRFVTGNWRPRSETDFALPIVTR